MVLAWIPVGRITKTDTPSSATTYSTSAVSAASLFCTSSLDTAASARAAA